MAKRFHSSDSEMVPSGAGSHANMPQELVMRDYPKAGSALPEGLDDSIRGIDSQISADDSKRGPGRKIKGF